MKKTTLRARRTPKVTRADSPTAALFGDGARQPALLEVHEHSFISGQRTGGHYERGVWHTGPFSHSHEGGDRPHQHPHTGPSAYTIDKDDWYRSTGLRGGGRKVFTSKPKGEQFPIKELEDWQKSFEVIVCDPSPDQKGTGPGMALPLRMIKQFGMTAQFIDGRKRAG